MLPQQMNFQTVAEDVKCLRSPGVSGELVLPSWSQDREQSGLS